MDDKMTYREEVADMFIKALEEDPIKFIKCWDFASTGNPTNVATQKPYNGINKFYLKMQEMMNGYGDSRWMTFNQIQSAGYSLKKGTKGTKVEYWMPYNHEKEKWATWNEFKGHENDTFIKKVGEVEVEQKLFSLRTRIYTVFNASRIEGLAPMDIKLIHNDIDESALVNEISEAMGVKINEVENSNEAYYNIRLDEIFLPCKEQFISNQHYNRTALHELGHSTGHESRLNRKMTGGFGSKDYAYEELVAEITSAFMGEFINEPLTEDVINNHKAYIQSWCSAIKDNKDYLFKAIKEAETACDYIIEVADLEKYRQLDASISKEETINYKQLAKKEAMESRQGLAKTQNVYNL